MGNIRVPVKTFTRYNQTMQNVHHIERGSGPPMVLLHGFPLDCRVFNDQLPDLADKYRVITPDLPGFGQSRSDESFTIDSQAEAVHAHLKKINALPCVLAGLSMGGYIALAFAQKFPTDLKGLALIDTKAAGDTPEQREGRKK
jgi:pimeloyl-ACP methyl ester carboxylesterase